IELVAEFRIEGAVRLVAACRRVGIMQPGAAAATLEQRADMAGTADTARMLAGILHPGHPRDDRDAMIALLRMQHDMLVAKLPEGREGELVLLAFDLLQAQDIRLVADDELLDDGHAQPHRVDVPGGDGECHSGSSGKCRRSRKFHALREAKRGPSPGRSPLSGGPQILRTSS